MTQHCARRNTSSSIVFLNIFIFFFSGISHGRVLCRGSSTFFADEFMSPPPGYALVLCRVSSLKSRRPRDKGTVSEGRAACVCGWREAVEKTDRRAALKITGRKRSSCYYLRPVRTRSVRRTWFLLGYIVLCTRNARRRVNRFSLYCVIVRAPCEIVKIGRIVFPRSAGGDGTAGEKR